MVEVVIHSLLEILTIHNILFIIAGVSLGTIIGAIPGLGPAMVIAILIPFTFYLGPLNAIIFLIAIYKGGFYGGSVSAILIGVPGAPPAAATVLDGYPMAKAGKSGKALKMALFASVFGDVFGNLCVIIVAIPLVKVALKFGPPENFAILVLSISIIGGVSGASLLRGLIASLLGILFSMVGMDTVTGVERFTFGILQLSDGIGLIPLMIGIFAISEVLMLAEKKVVDSEIESSFSQPTEGGERLSFFEFRKSLRTLLEGSIIGAFIGALPGLGGSISAFISYGRAMNRSKNPENFGKGEVEGVAASEAANNASCGAALIPLITLGIPGDIATAVLMGAFLIHGMLPGPTLIPQHPELIYPLFVGLIICDAFMVPIGLLCIRYASKVSSMKKSIVFSIVLIICIVGSYGVNGRLFDVYVAVFFGVVGYLMRKFDFPLAPFLIAFILGDMLEVAFRQSMIISGGSLTIFVTSPISLACLIATFLMLIAIARGRKRMNMNTRKAAQS